ncbi:hypothetical protein Pmar_PMAR023591 [Perkinsus marinus ATCC 50983]|uniref:Uncharacterized protein n=1 Tax=Perkinsus marinus (strain ATCC 50983 / TXsc) TaxID=423536 RepID=C5KCS1_PERM5|nr:hypothetical protein Pmar_PMAR023591 [Perkinsus marinus ATCC 50983]EER17670.1 hypothetical protein Pmar_PMAR023591 [Perkinsus marinus ATCC 50983]|eukprot:XP_002785874.1 hypothetical protein Pmar_PMAR023591 [Perkinsus marinus ATCC 50983]
MVAVLKTGCLPRQVSGRVCAQSAAQWMWEWSQLDVFALALFITLFVFNAFSLLRAVAPWGFYCVLMAAMSGFELAKHDLPPMLRMAQHDLVEMDEIVCEEEGEEEEEQQQQTVVEPGVIKHRREHSGSSSFSEERLRSRVDSVASTVTIAKSRRLGNCCRGLVRIVQKLGLPFFVLKAIGWIIFFVIWWVNSGNARLDLAGVNETLLENAPLVTSGLRDFLPDMVGQCPPELPRPDICRDIGPLYHDKSTVMEVLSRWLSGLRSVSVEELSLGVPRESELEMSIAGSFDELSMSLYIGQCITPDNLFRSTNDTMETNDGDGTKKKFGKPICSALWDKVYSWKQVGWGLIISASCNEEWPYVRNIAIKDVTLDQNLKISEQLVFGITINVDDLTTRFRDGFQKALMPYIVSKSPWIRWGADEYDMTELLNQLHFPNTLSSAWKSPAEPQRAAVKAPIELTIAPLFDSLEYIIYCTFVGAVASVSSLTWRTRTDRTTVEDFERELALGSSKVDYLSALEREDCQRNVQELRCVRRAMEWLKEESKPIQLPVTGTVLAKWCKVPVVTETGKLQSFIKNEDLCDAVSAVGVTARAFSILANHDNDKVFGAFRNIERSEVVIIGCLDLLTSVSPELLLRIAWLELDGVDRRSHVDGVPSTSIFCRCIMMLTELLKNGPQAECDPDLRCSVRELVAAVLASPDTLWAQDDGKLMKVGLALLQNELKRTKMV